MSIKQNGKILSIDIDEEKLAKNIFTLNKTSQVKIISELKREHSCYLSFFTLVIRYLLKETLNDAEMVKKLLYKYSVIFSSVLFFGANACNNPLSVVINGGLSIERLIDTPIIDNSSNIFVKLFNKKDYWYDSEFKNCDYEAGFSNELYKNYKEAYIELHKIMLCNVEFFNIKNDLRASIEDKKNSKKIDEIIASELVNNECFNDFIKISFKIDESNVEKFINDCLNVDTVDEKHKATAIKSTTPLACILLYYLFRNNNDISKELTLRKKIYYQIISGAQKEMQFGRVRIVKQISENTYRFDFSCIKEDILITMDIGRNLNDKYVITKNGIEEYQNF